MTDEQPSKLKYVIAWVIASILGNLVVQISGVGLAEVLVQSASDLNKYFLVSAIFNGLILAGAFILVYNFFSTLNVKVVFPYMVTLGAFGTLLVAVQTVPMYSKLNVNNTVIYISALGQLIIWLYVVRWYFISKPERWLGP